MSPPNTTPQPARLAGLLSRTDDQAERIPAGYHLILIPWLKSAHHMDIQARDDATKGLCRLPVLHLLEQERIRLELLQGGLRTSHLLLGRLLGSIRFPPGNHSRFTSRS